jgi:hypothetical protein
MKMHISFNHEGRTYDNWLLCTCVIFGALMLDHKFMVHYWCGMICMVNIYSCALQAGWQRYHVPSRSFAPLHAQGVYIPHCGVHLLSVRSLSF